MTIQDLKNNAVQSFTESGSTTPFLDADCLLQFLFNKDKTWILLHRNENVAPALEADFAKLVQKRKTGLPVAYITGKKEFYGIEYYVTPDVLIPKPDTEILVEKAVEKIRACFFFSCKIRAFFVFIIGVRRSFVKFRQLVFHGIHPPKAAILFCSILYHAIAAETLFLYKIAF